ncbi:MAG: glycosyltransferase family 4 protein, partial [Bacteroidota bacterium]
RFVADYVPNDQVAIYFSAADVAVLPYLAATQSGIAQIAYNFDKPVITTNVGGLAEVVIEGKTGFVVPPDDPRALAEAIIRFYDEGVEQTFSANVRAEKKKYSWENLVEKIEELMA